MYNRATKVITVIFLIIVLLFLIVSVIWLYMSNYWIGEKCVDEKVIKINSEYTIEKNIPDNMEIRDMLQSTKNISPNINNRLPNKLYNPSSVDIGERGYVILSKVSSFSKCNETRDKSNEIYRNTPMEHSSSVILTYIPPLEPTPYYTKERLDKKNGGSILLDIPINDDFVPKQPFVPGYEDPRPFVQDNAIWFVCNARLNSSLGKARMFLVYVCEIDELSNLKYAKKCSVYKIESKLIKSTKDEKNWSPINSISTYTTPNTLQLVYSILPLTIMSLDLPNIENRKIDVVDKKVGKIITNYENEYLSPTPRIHPSILKHIEEKGDDILRCSTQVKSIRILEYCSCYLSFGHIRYGERYWIFPYIFTQDNGYQLSEIGEPRELLGPDTQCYVSGFTSESGYGSDDYHLTFGINDCYSGSIKLNRHDIENWIRDE